MNRDDEFEKLEEALRRAGGEVNFPRTPQLAVRVRAELERARRPQPRFGLFAGFAAAAVLLAVLGGVWLATQQPVASPAPARGKAYVANLLGGNLSVVELRSDTLLGSIPVGSNPWGIAVAPSGGRVYVAVDGGIAIVDTARAQRVDFVATSPAYSRAKVAISADERILLVAGTTRDMRLIDVPTRGTLNEFSIEMIPYDIKLSPDGRWAYVLSETDGSLAIVDVRAGQMVQRLTLSGAYRGYFMAQSPDGRFIYVPRLAKSEMWIVDTTTNQARGTLTDAKPYWKASNGQGTERGVVVSPDGKRLYVATQDDVGGGVSVLDTQSFAEVARANMGSGFFGAALSADGAQLLLSVPENNHLTILDAATLKLITSLEVGAAPFRVVVGQ